MSKHNKPTPPPLDDEQAVAAGGHSDAPHAESGKATADDAKFAAARDAAAARDEALGDADATTEARTAPAPASTEVTNAANKLAGGIAIAASTVDVNARPGAVIAQRSGQFVARPDPSKPISATEAVVHSNWVGRYHDEDGNDCPAYVKHGTPIADLPKDLVRQIRETRGQIVGPLPPKAPQNPFTP
jgi:hypothetical protein